MKFNGVMLIIQGAMYCLNCIGAFIGVPLIIAGIALFGGADTLEQTGGVSHGMLPFLQKFKSFNTALGVYHVIMLVLLVLSVVLVIAFFGVFAAMLDQALKAAGGMP